MHRLSARLGLAVALVLLAAIGAVWLGLRHLSSDLGDAPSAAERPPAIEHSVTQMPKELVSPAEPQTDVKPEPAPTPSPPATPVVVRFQDQRVLQPERPVAAVVTPAPSPAPEKPESKAAPVRFQDARKLAGGFPAQAAAPAPAPLRFQDTRKLGSAQAAVPAPAASAPQAAVVSFQDSRGMVTPAAALPSLAAPARGAAPKPASNDQRLCPVPEIATEPLAGGLMRIRVASPCRAREPAQIGYGGARLIRQIDAAGQLDMVLDLFAGTTSRVDLRFADGTTLPVEAAALDLDRVTKVAIVWRQPVNLDLHVFEYAAREGQPGHVWSRLPASLDAAREQARAGPRGRGYLSTADDGRNFGDKLEVYTFFHHDAQAAGTIALALDHESRGESPSGAMCGPGELAEVGYEITTLARRGQLTREAGILTPAACGVRLASSARLNAGLLPLLRVGR